MAYWLWREAICSIELFHIRQDVIHGKRLLPIFKSGLFPVARSIRPTDIIYMRQRRLCWWGQCQIQLSRIKCMCSDLLPWELWLRVTIWCKTVIQLLNRCDIFKWHIFISGCSRCVQLCVCWRMCGLVSSISSSSPFTFMLSRNLFPVFDIFEGQWTVNECGSLRYCVCSLRFACESGDLLSKLF